MVNHTMDLSCQRNQNQLLAWTSYDVAPTDLKQMHKRNTPALIVTNDKASQVLN